MQLRVRLRTVVAIAVALALAAFVFEAGAIHAGDAERRADANYERQLTAVRAELDRARADQADAIDVKRSANDAAPIERSKIVAEVKAQLESEMGLVPLSVLRQRQTSFVALHVHDAAGHTEYGTAGYLGDGYFITVKHALVSLNGSRSDSEGSRNEAIRVVYKDKEIPAEVVDTGDARREVDPGDWAIIRTRPLDLPALVVDTAFAYEFAEPIFRLGNDYSKGISVSTGYVGQRTSAGLVTCLTDGHPGVSGGGVLDRRGVLVGIPIGRMEGDYRFSFILPVRSEMLRKVPASLLSSSPAPAIVENQPADRLPTDGATATVAH
jgi:Trypsin-like peptidase domain